MVGVVAEDDREALREKLADLQQTFNHDDEIDEIDTWALLMRLLDEHYPSDVFPGGNGSDPGPRIVGLIRALDEARTQIATHTCTRCGDGDLYPRRCSQCGQRWADLACGPTHALITEELCIGDLRREFAQLREERAQVREVLAELVRLKDGARDDTYRAVKDAAWARAREVLGDG